MNTQSMDYLAILDGAPPERQAAMIQAWMRSEPLPFFAQLRRERPVLVTPACTRESRFDHESGDQRAPISNPHPPHRPPSEDNTLIFVTYDALFQQDKTYSNNTRTHAISKHPPLNPPSLTTQN